MQPTLTEARTDGIRAEVEQVLEPVLGSVAQREGVVEQITEILEVEAFRGPMAHPRHMAAYDAVCPGLADRIAKMAEYGQQKREERIDRVIGLEYQDRQFGMTLGFRALIAMLACGTLLTALGHTEVGVGLLGVATLSGIVGLFVNGRGRAPVTERAEKAERSKGLEKKPEGSGGVTPDQGRSHKTQFAKSAK